jgi:hypothetical protein
MKSIGVIALKLCNVHGERELLQLALYVHICKIVDKARNEWPGRNE